MPTLTLTSPGAGTLNGPKAGDLPFVAWSRQLYGSNGMAGDKGYVDVEFDFRDRYQAWTGTEGTSADNRDALTYTFALADANGVVQRTYSNDGDAAPTAYVAQSRAVIADNVRGVADSYHGVRQFRWAAEDIAAAGPGTYTWTLTVSDGCSSTSTSGNFKVLCDADPALTMDQTNEMGTKALTMQWQGRDNRFGAETTNTRWYVSKRATATECPKTMAKLTEMHDAQINAAFTDYHVTLTALSPGMKYKKLQILTQTQTVGIITGLASKTYVANQLIKQGAGFSATVATSMGVATTWVQVKTVTGTFNPELEVDLHDVVGNHTVLLREH